MTEYNLVTSEVLEKLYKCFSDVQEFTNFVHHINGVTEELTFSNMLRDRARSDEQVMLCMRQVSVLVLFFREHVDLIHELLKNMNTTPMTEEEMRKYKENE